MKILPILIFFAIALSKLSIAQQPECDYAIEILAEGDEFQKEEFTWRMMATKIEGKSTNITGAAKIEDSGGSTVKTYKPWTSDSISKQKTSSKYTPNLKPGKYEIIAEISVECDDTGKDNNMDTKKITISGDAGETKPKDTTDDAEEDSKITNKKNTETKNTDSDAEQIETKPVQKTKASSPRIEEKDNVIQLAANVNKNIQKPQMKTSEIQKPEVVYESSNEKAKGLIMIFLLSLSILLNIVLIWRR